MNLWIPKNRKELKQHLNDPLFKNAYFLMLSSVTSAGSGFFWIIFNFNSYPLLYITAPFVRLLGKEINRVGKIE